MQLIKSARVSPVTIATTAHRPIPLIAKRFIQTLSTVPPIGIRVALNHTQSPPIYSTDNTDASDVGKPYGKEGRKCE